MQSEIPTKQSLKYRIPLVKNEGPFALKDITNDKEKSIARLAGSQIVMANSSFISLMKHHNGKLQLQYEDVKSQLSNARSLQSIYNNIQQQLTHIQAISSNLKHQQDHLREQLKSFGELYLAQQNQIIEQLKPIIRTLSHNIRDNNLHLNEQIYQYKRELDEVASFRFKFINSTIDCSTRIQQLETTTGVDTLSTKQ